VVLQQHASSKTFEKTKLMKSSRYKNEESLSVNALVRLSKLNSSFKAEELDIPIEYLFDSRHFDAELMEIILEKLDRSDFARNLNNHHAIIDYIRLNHLHYLDNALPAISLAFWRAIEAAGPNLYTLDLCNKVFFDFSRALARHIEEEELFFKLLLHQTGGLNGAINFFTTQHENEHVAIDEILLMLKELTNEKVFDPLNILITQLQNLSADLKIHNFVEEKVLLPALIAVAEKSNHHQK
jgi:iron-sulfur cluster repair protein YtfE (RIC family)